MATIQDLCNFRFLISTDKERNKNNTCDHEQIVKSTNFAAPFLCLWVHTSCIWFLCSRHSFPRPNAWRFLHHVLYCNTETLWLLHRLCTIINDCTSVIAQVEWPPFLPPNELLYVFMAHIVYSNEFKKKLLTPSVWT